MGGASEERKMLRIERKKNKMELSSGATQVVGDAPIT